MPARLAWAAQAFLELSGDRDWIATFGGAAPRSISEAAVRGHYFETLGLRSAKIFAAFRRWIRAMDTEWQRDWSEKAKARAEAERRDAQTQRRGGAPA